MPCYKPLHASRDAAGRVRVFARGCGPVAEAFWIPCGRCVGCLLERTRQWAVRLVHERVMTSQTPVDPEDPGRGFLPSSFVTLTYDDSHLPAEGLVKADLQKFFRRVRKSGRPFRYFACGEYGGRTRRAHYHAILFGLDFSSDRRFHSFSRNARLYSSDVLDGLWSKGRCLIGDVSYHSCSYVARYVVKSLPSNVPKVDIMRPPSGRTLRADRVRHAAERIRRDGEQTRSPEFALMSRRPGLGSSFFHAYKDWIYPRDQVVVEGKLMRPPAYYDYLLEKADPQLFAAVKLRRQEEQDGSRPDLEVLFRRGVARQKMTDQVSQSV